MNVPIVSDVVISILVNRYDVASSSDKAMETQDVISPNDDWFYCV